MANFIYVNKTIGYIDVDDIIQVHHPDGASEIDLDKPELAVRFASPIYDGHTHTTVMKVEDKDTASFIIAALGLLKAPTKIEEIALTMDEHLLSIQWMMEKILAALKVKGE